MFLSVNLGVIFTSFCRSLLTDVCQTSKQCRERVEQNSYKVVQMLLFVVVTRSIASYTCHGDVVLMSPKLVDKLLPGNMSFYTARSDEKWRHKHDVSAS